MTTRSPSPCSVLLLLSLTSFFAGAALLRSAEHPTTGFCDRSEATKTCPSPPTFDHLHISSYSGSWYQIGAGAQFLFSSEPGLACGHVRYTLAGNDTIIVVNTGLTVLSPSGVADVVSVGASSSIICSGARAVCYSTSPSDSLLYKAARQISYIASKWKADRYEKQASSLSTISQQLSTYSKALRVGVDTLAEGVSSVQLLLNQVSQANASLLDSIASIRKRTTKLRKQDIAAAGEAIKGLQEAKKQLVEIIRESWWGPAREDAEALEQAGEWIGRTAKVVRGGVKKMRKGVRALEKGASSLRESGKPVEQGKLFEIVGQAVQVNASGEAGKLVVDFFGQPSPYWVLAIEGDYEAAIVYSCTPGRESGQLDKSIFILSRTPSLSPLVVSRFISLARSYGIYSDCDDPFLRTVHRGSSCGLPTIN